MDGTLVWELSATSTQEGQPLSDPQFILIVDPSAKRSLVVLRTYQVSQPLVASHVNRQQLR